MNRWLQLMLLMPEDEFITYKELSEELGISVRTVYDDIIRLNEMMLEHGAQLVARPHHGVTLDVHDRTRFLRFLDALGSGNTVLGDTSEARIGKIIRTLLGSSAPCKSDNLCEALHISRSTLKKDLRGVRALLGMYDLRLVHQPYAGLSIRGAEKDIRRCLVRLKRGVLAGDGSILHQEVQQTDRVLQEIFKQHDCRMAAYSFQDFVLHIDVSVERIRQGHEMGDEDLSSLPAAPQDETLSRAVVVAMETQYRLQFSAGECRYILLLLMSRKVLSWKQASTAAADVYAVVMEMLAAVQHTFCYDFSHDFELIVSLSTHLIPLRTRLLFGMQQENPVGREIREGGPLAYEMANVACGILRSAYGCEVSADETGYIALYFHVALERMRAQRKKRVLIVCGAGKGAAMLLAHTIEENYGKYLEVIGTYEAADFSDTDLQAADYILSTIPLRETLPVPVIELGDVLPWQAGGDLRAHLMHDRQEAMLAYFAEQLFLPQVSAATREDALRKICAAAEAVEELPQDFYDAVVEREHIGGTALGNLVATPHPARPMGGRSFVVVAVLDQPILWGEEDAQILFLVSMKDGGDRDLPQFYKMIGRFLTNRTLVRRLIKRPTFDELRTIFSALADEVCRMD